MVLDNLNFTVYCVNYIYQYCFIYIIWEIFSKLLWFYIQHLSSEIYYIDLPHIQN